MLRKLQSKRGFTLVEVMVAFVIFAIMSAMVSMILAGTNQAKLDNKKVSDEIETQKERYYLKDHKKEYKAAEKDGTLTFNFEGSSPMNIDYNVGDPNAETDENILALKYFIGDVNYENGGGGGDDDKGGGGAGSVTSRLDSRIYGSTGISSLSVKLKRDESYSGTGYRYTIATMASYDVPIQQNWFVQYRLLFPSTILDYGYTNQSDSVTSFSSRRNVNTEKFEVYSPYSRTLRIATKQSSTESEPAIKAKYVYYYVVLKDKLEDIDAGLDLNKIFGYSDTEMTPTLTEYGSYSFKPYMETYVNDKGETETEKHVNIFGAFPREEVSEETGEATGEATTEETPES